MRWVVVLIALLLAGCGRVTSVQEKDVVVGRADAAATTDSGDRQGRGLQIARARIVFVTHGQASDPFWTVVKRGMNDAAKQTQVAVSYRAPDRFSIPRMIRYINEAVADRPDGLVVSLPDIKRLGPAIKNAVAAGIPVITINSGSDEFKSLGVLAHVGQPEYEAGVESGERLGRAGVKHALCVNQEAGNGGLDERCRGLADGLRKSGGSARSLGVPLQDPATAQRRMAEEIASRPVDGILTLGPNAAGPALAAVNASGMAKKITLATFDLSP